MSESQTRKKGFGFLPRAIGALGSMALGAHALSNNVTVKRNWRNSALATGVAGKGVGRVYVPLVHPSPSPAAVQASPMPTVATLAKSANATLTEVKANATAFVEERASGTLTQGQVNAIITPTVKANLTNTINTTLALTARPSPDATPEERAVLATVRAELVDFVNKTATELNIPEIAASPSPVSVQTYGNAWGASEFNLHGVPVAAKPAAEHPVVVPGPPAVGEPGIVHRGLGEVGKILGKLNPGSNTYKQVMLVGVCTVVVVGTVVMLAPEGALLGIGNTILGYLGYATPALEAATGALAPAAAIAAPAAAIAAEGAAIAGPIVGAAAAAAPEAAAVLAAGGAGAAVGGGIDLLLQAAADYAADPAMAQLMANMGRLALGGRRKHKSMRKRSKFAKRSRASVRSRR
jgi:hypothetical protein